jgi:HPt (histidine-containing phosphotransfer) domain-containing protein
MSSAGQAVDLNHLDRYTGGDRAINEEILRLFDTQCQEMLVKLDHLAAESGHAEEWRRVTHTLKGAAAGVGAFSLAEAAEAAEKACDDRLAALATLQKLKHRSLAVRQFVEEFLQAGV